MEVKRKRGRPKKVQVPDEIQQLINVVNETKKKEDNEFHEIVEEVKKEYRSGKWDVPLGKDIEFFDKRLSYENTRCGSGLQRVKVQILILVGLQRLEIQN